MTLLEGALVTPARGQPSIALRQVTEIGCVSCGDARLLSNVLGITLDPNGNVHILDATRPKLRVFDGNGKLLRAGMTEGREPGQGLLPIAVIVTDRGFHLIDMGLSRVSSHGPDGGLLSYRELAETPVAVAHRWPLPYIFVATIDYRAEAATTTIWRLGLTDTTMVAVRSFGEAFPRGRDGEPTTYFAFTMTPTGGFAVGEGAYAYRIRVFDEAGQPLRDIERDIPRTRMTELELRRARERRRLAMGRIGSLARLEGGNPGPFAEIDPEENYFSATALRYDARGRLWVKTDRGSRETIFDIFDDEGNLVAQARADDALGVYDISDRYLAGFGFGPRDVPVVRLYRMTGR